MRLLGKPESWLSENVRHPHGEYESRLYCNSAFCRAYLGETHGRKKYHYVYWPGGPEILEVARSEVSGKPYKAVKDKLAHSGVEIGLFRDFATQRLEQLAHENNIRLDAVNLVLSRELSVTGAHYLDTRNWADRLFSIYVEWLRNQGVIPAGAARRVVNSEV
jgi:intergrase/recombinase